jgi:hypothetical protein
MKFDNVRTPVFITYRAISHNFWRLSQSIQLGSLGILCVGNINLNGRVRLDTGPSGYFAGFLQLIDLGNKGVKERMGGQHLVYISPNENYLIALLVQMVQYGKSFLKRKVRRKGRLICGK